MKRWSFFSAKGPRGCCKKAKYQPSLRQARTQCRVLPASPRDSQPTTFRLIRVPRHSDVVEAPTSAGCLCCNSTKARLLPVWRATMRRVSGSASDTNKSGLLIRTLRNFTAPACSCERVSCLCLFFQVRVRYCYRISSFLHINGAFIIAFSAALLRVLRRRP